MRKSLKNSIIWLLVFVLPLAFSGCQKNHQPETAAGGAYTCPMHPQIVQDKPGDCPVCGMTLVPRQIESTTQVPPTSDLNYLLQPANQAILSSVRTIKPVQKAVQSEITMHGIITYDTRQQYIIPARFGGRIEKLYVQFNYQPIRKGQKLYDIYSPELITAQKELIYLLQHDGNNTDLILGAKQKLRLLGATEEQIKHLVRTRQASYLFPVFSSYSGYVLDPGVTAAPAVASTSPAESADDGMGGMGGAGGGNSVNSNNATTNTAPTAGFSIREGMYVSTGQPLLKVISARQVWAEFKVAGAQAAKLTEGTPVTITFNQIANQTIQAPISLVQSFYNPNENFAQIRVSLPTQNKQLLIGQLVTGKVNYDTGRSLWVPQEAVLDLGTQSVVFLKAGGVFKPVAVTVGQQTGHQAEILKGLNTQDNIAGNAQFLVDSESFIPVEAN